MTATAGYKVDGARTRFMTGASEIFARKQAGLYPLITEEINPEGNLTVQVTMAGDTPVIRKWVADRQAQNYRELRETIPTDPYEATLPLKRRQVDGDPTGVTNNAIDRFLGGLGYIYEKLVWEMLLTNPTGIDGVSILNDTHPYGSSTTWDNKVTTALSFSSYNSAKAAMRGTKTEFGEFLDLAPTHLFVGPANERTAKEIVGAQRPIVWTTAGAEASSGTANSAGVIGNVYQGDVTVVVVNRFADGTNDNSWLLYDANKKCPPVALVPFRAPQALSVTDMTSWQRWTQDEYLFGVECDVGVAGLYPWAIYGRLG